MRVGKKRLTSLTFDFLESVHGQTLASHYPWSYMLHFQISFQYHQQLCLEEVSDHPGSAAGQ